MDLVRAIAIDLAWTIGLLSVISIYGSEILARSQPNLLDKRDRWGGRRYQQLHQSTPKIESSLAGTAISVALMPPICMIGLGLTQADWYKRLGAALLYLTNLLGIILSCMVSFSIKGYTPVRQVRKALGWVLALTGILVISLTLSFISLVPTNSFASQ